MPNSDENKNINEVIVNGETLLSTRRNTVTEDTLAEGETAQDKSGKTIIGNMQGGNNSNPYFVTDSLSSNLSEDDYIPYYDVSEQKKHNTLLSKFVDFLKGIFITGSNSDADIYLTGQSFTLKMHDIDASEPDNNIDAIKYPSTSNIFDNEDRIITRFESKVNPNGNIGAKFYVRNYDEEGNAVGQKGISFDMDKSGNLTYTIDEPNKFRQAINTVDQQGIAIPDNANLDSYKTAGTYKIISDASAQTMTNIPTNVCGKLVVFDNNNGGYEQFYFSNHSPRIYLRTWWSNAWSAWAELTANAKPHTYELGTEIPANADLNTYTTEGVYQCLLSDTARTMSNLPYTGYNRVAFKLVVTKVRQSSNILQLYTSYINSNNAMANSLAYRLSDDNGSTWGIWHIVADVDAVPYLSEPDIAHQISANEDLNDYTESGTYQCNNANIAVTLSNCPVDCSFKLIVDRQYVGTYSEITQRITCQNKEGSTDWYRTKMYNLTTWGKWKHLASTDDIAASFNSGYAVATKNGSAITATINGFVLKAGVIVSLKMPSAIEVDSTLNINGTGAKSIKFWGDNPISYGRSLGIDITATFIYDGTYYRVISLDRTPYVAIQNYIADTGGNILLDWGYDVNRAQIKYGVSNNKLAWNYYKNSAWRGDVTIADYDDLGASIAKVGKSILPIWNYPTNARTHNGITFTFNQSTGEISANGTATADANCILAGSNVSHYYKIPKGTYVLSGCPSGGANDKYFISLQYYDSEFHSQLDYGDGNKFTLNNDVYCNISQNNNYYILIRSGQTVSNLVFKPMLRPAFTTADFEPCEDIHKGNCYVGTCTTAGDTKDKVAYVDGYFVLRKGVRVAIKFSNSNTYSNVTTSPITLNVNGTGAKYIWVWSTHSGAGNTGIQTAYYGHANRYIYYVYDGTYWVWDGASGDNNNTNYLRNDASSTLTASNGVFLNMKDSAVDMTQANNGVTTTLYPAYITQDKNGMDMSRLETVVESNGQIRTFIQVCNYNTTTNAHFRAGLTMFTNKSQDVWYNLSNPHYFHRELGCGYGTCSTAGSERVKVVTMPRFRLVGGGIIGVKFTNTNTYSATAENKVCLNVNGTGEKPIYYNTGYPTGTMTGIFGFANRVVYYMYDGANWCWLSFGYDNDSTYSPQSLGFGYGTCSTAEATTAKVASLSGYNLITNGYVTIKFTYAVPANSTLNINSKGAKEIWHRGVRITANIIKTNDLATFIYDGTRYQLVGVDRDNIEFDKSNVTIISSINSCITASYIYGNLNGNQLFFKIEIGFKPTSAITISSSDNFIIFNGLRALYQTNNFWWQDVQGYFEYTNMQPMVIGNYNGNSGDLILRFRGTQNFTANVQRTFRLNFTVLAEKY